MLYSEQSVYCPVCGKAHKNIIAGKNTFTLCCSTDCWRELEWRTTLSIMGRDYYPRPM